MTTLHSGAMVMMVAVLLMQVTLNCGKPAQITEPVAGPGLIANRADARCITASTSAGAEEDIIRMLSSQGLTRSEYSDLRDGLIDLGVEDSCPAYFDSDLNRNAPTARCQRAAISAGLTANVKNLLNADADDLTEEDVKTIRIAAEGAGIKTSCIQYFQR